jgi:hypothetical protein
LLDFSQPVAVIMAAVLHFVPDEANPYAAVAGYVEAMAPGSLLVLSHGTYPGHRRYAPVGEMYRQSGSPTAPRTREQIQEFLAGTEILEPGVVWTPHWRPEFDHGEHPEPALIYAAVGRKP